ncbi:hypothetical protein F5Y15DRAFT_427914 [Xylariaceae sp. FL0016]|nr:hypothetical protein F5Y15DRAFT_427914 [Xylariaceae sp. FL0016]
MDDRDRIPSCLSIEPHDEKVTDHIAHFLGCIDIGLRNDFFEPTAGIWKAQIAALVQIGFAQPEAEARVGAQRKRWENECEDEVRRLCVLRHAVAQDEYDNYLVKNVEKSAREWRESDAYTSNIRRLLQKGSVRNSNLNAKLRSLSWSSRTVDLRMTIMNTSASFPGQFTTMDRLLDPDERIVYRNRLPERLKFFHIPSNNMAWVEQIMSIYYGESRPSPEQLRGDDFRTSRTAMLLRESHWRGQLYGSKGNPKSRFMRPFCDSVSSETRDRYNRSRNIVLMSPYLHWETSRQQSYFSHEIEDYVFEFKHKILEQELMAKERRQQARKSLGVLSPPSGPSAFVRLAAMYKRLPSNEKGRPAVRIRSLWDVLEQFRVVLHLSYRPEFEKDVHGRIRVRNQLGQYWLDAARLYEGMMNFRDKKLLRKYLCDDAPLHPRRTLDQGFYTTLSSTRARDRNQVVYRATTADPYQTHQFNAATNTWECHDFVNSKYGCAKCRADIRKVSRVVMVDQLWMWILDNKTIITCFPKRCGISGHDASGIYESIQSRLARTEEIRSAFDVALVILDECSDTFFNRTKDSTGQPQVLDTFSEAIRHVTQKQTIQFEQLWRWIDRGRRANRQEDESFGDAISNLEWTAGVEGELEKEIQDIVEELEIMISIFTTQQTLFKRFIRQAKSVLDPRGLKTGPGRATNPPLDGRPPADDTYDSEASDNYHRFQASAEELLVKVSDRIDYLQMLLKSASAAADVVKDLSQLRQQQDSVVQAYQSVTLSREGINQGRAIMVFTVVTIIFSPLSFMSSIFGMNNAEFGDNQLSINDQLKLIFPVSLAVVMLSLIFASHHEGIFPRTVPETPLTRFWGLNASQTGGYWVDQE